MAARRKRNRQRRRRGRFGGLYKLLSFLIIFAALLAGCVVFFRVNQVVVTGNSRYTTEEIIAASGVEIGDNLFLVNRPQTAQSITRRLPYVESVAPVHRLPDTVEIHITECVPAAVLPTEEEGWWLIDARGKLLEQGDSAIGRDLPVVLGLTPTTPSLGAATTVEPEQQSRLEGLRGLLTALSKRNMLDGLGEFIDVNASNVIYFDYGPDLTVAVPTAGNFDQRVFSLQRVLETFQQRGEAVTGTLDLTYGDDQARLLTDRWLPETTIVRGGSPDGAIPADSGTVPVPPDFFGGGDQAVPAPEDGGQAPAE